MVSGSSAVRCLVALAMTLVLASPAISQAPLTVVREFVLPSPGWGVANAIIEVQGGGFAALGYIDGGGPSGTDALLVRFDATGDTLWTRVYGGDREEFGWDLVEAPDGGFFFVGYVEAPSEGSEDVLVLRVTEDGEPVWQRTFGGAGRDRAWSATSSGSGGIAIAAESENVDLGERDAYVLLLSGDGELIWDTRVDAPGDQRVYSIARSEDGAFVVTGTSGVDPESTRDAYVVKVDSDGGIEWERSFGDSAPDDVGHGVAALAGGDILVSGYGATRSSGGTDIYLIRLAPNGDLRWWQHDGTPANDRVMMSAPTEDGYVSVGFSWTSSDTDIGVWESDADGSVHAHTVFPRPGSNRGVMLLVAGGGEYVVAGTVGRTRSRPGDFAVLWLER